MIQLIMAIRDSRESYRAYHNAYQLRRYHNIRAGIIAEKGGACAACGSKENLELDHEDPKLKRMSLGKTMKLGRKKLADELAKIQLLCKPCHIAKSILESGKTVAKGRHGTKSSYKHCHCQLCRDAHAAYTRSYRLRRGRSTGRGTGL